MGGGRRPDPEPQLIVADAEGAQARERDPCPSSLTNRPDRLIFDVSRNIKLRGAMTHDFCGSSNRVRSTFTGMLFTCLGQGDVADLRVILRSGAPDDELDAVFMRRSPAT